VWNGTSRKFLHLPVVVVVGEAAGWLAGLLARALHRSSVATLARHLGFPAIGVSHGFASFVLLGVVGWQALCVFFFLLSAASATFAT
jgi:hypothetical protein